MYEQEQRTGRMAHLVLTLAIVELTLTTAFIHFSLGGALFTLNAAGYVALAGALVVTTVWPVGLIGKLAWVPRVALAAYTVATIVGYLVMGPYFALGWIAKAVERIGDHAKNIAEQVIYIVKGADVRHTDMANVERQALG